MGSVKDPETQARPEAEGQASLINDSGRRTSVQLDCPPDVAVAFLAKVYAASPRLRETGLSIEASRTDGVDR